ncbi:hypothetical protein BDV93DRAFT_519992 [Ceratobasidium sp. AG-I]|nr:hypothetical protein BDV93DRAFT_519992 [Ceratobasidium sp. AG-I]
MSEPNLSRLHGLIIGVNHYVSPHRTNLNGCVGDAKSIMDYLIEKLHVPEDQLVLLFDHQATRKGIIDTFALHLISNPNINPLDPILIYFAGHGDRLAAPREWHTSDGFCEMILPHDASEPTQREDVINEVPPAQSKNFTHGIPDRTLRALIYKLSQVKGDNITVILDSCFSGSGTRGSSKARLSHIEGCPIPPPDLDEDVLRALSIAIPEEVQQPSEAQKKPSRTAFASSLDTHVLLAACHNDELAQEDIRDGRVAGVFTSALLRALRESDLATTSYSALIQKIVKYAVIVQPNGDRVQVQTPQCEGRNQDRLLLQTKFSLSKGMIALQRMEDPRRFKIKVGGASGINVGTEFGVFAGNTPSTGTPVAQLVATHVGAVKSVLSSPQPNRVIEVPDDAYVVVTKYNNRENGVRLLVTEESKLRPYWQEVFQNLRSLPIDVIWTKPDEPYDLALVPTDTGADLLRRDPELDAELQPVSFENEYGARKTTKILTSIIHFHFHLQRRNPDRPLRADLGMKLVELRKESKAASWGFSTYAPAENSVDLFGESVSSGEVVEMQTDPDKHYGLTITNKSKRSLFPYVLYYDLEDYSIACLSAPASRTMRPPLTPGGEMPVGYGNSDTDPLTVVASTTGAEVQTGFFVLFVSSQWVDISHIEQGSPFGEAEGTRNHWEYQGPPEPPVWDTVVVRVSITQS